jgi:hypothetical protein
MHREFMTHAHEVQLTSSKSEQQSLFRTYRIKGHLALGFLSSMLMCHSFLLGTMHLFFENVIPLLVELWLHTFHSKLPNNDNFTIGPNACKAITESGVESWNTRLASFGA